MARRPGQVLCGFSMETENAEQNARAKLAKKHVDLIVSNNLREEGAGFGVDTNRVTIITKEKSEALPLLAKEQVAHVLLDRMRDYAKTV